MFFNINGITTKLPQQLPSHAQRSSSPHAIHTPTPSRRRRRIRPTLAKHTTRRNLQHTTSLSTQTSTHRRSLHTGQRNTGLDRGHVWRRNGHACVAGIDVLAAQHRCASRHVLLASGPRCTACCGVDVCRWNHYEWVVFVGQYRYCCWCCCCC